MDMQTYTLKRDGEPNLRFDGELIAEVSSSDERSASDYSGSTGRWSELALYRTKGGKLVASEVGRTRWQGEHDRHSATVCADAAAVAEALGPGWLAKQLYDAAELDVAEVVE